MDPHRGNSTYPIIEVVDLASQLGRVEVQPGVLGELVELRVEHADDLGALVVHNHRCATHGTEEVINWSILAIAKGKTR